MRSLLTSFSLVSFLAIGSSQSKVTLAVKIMDTEIVCAKDSTQKNILFQYKYDEEYKNVKNFVSNKCFNTYTISKVSGKFRLSIISKDHKPGNLDFEITDQTKDTLYLGELYLSKNKKVNPSNGEKEIEGVVVTGIREKFIRFDANKTTYTIKDNDFLSGGSTEDALKKLPGVIKGFGGELTVNGKNLAIYMDDSPTGLTGSDLENLLQSIPASSIEKIEIISNPGAAYEANTGGGIINIVTDGKALRGLNGTVTLNYRFNRNNKISPSINLNTRINNVSLQLNSGFNYREWDRTSIYDREFTSFSPSVFFSQKNKEDAYNRYYYFRPSANIKLNDKSNLLLNYNFSHTHNDSYYAGESHSGTAINLINNSKLRNNNSNHEFIAKYKTKLDSLGKNLDVTAYYSRFNKNTLNKGSQNNALDFNRYSLSDVESDYSNFYAKTNLEIPFKKIDLSLNLGGKYSIANSSSSGKYNLLDSLVIPDSPQYKSYLDFDYDEYQYALYSEVSKNLGKLSLTAGLRYENLQYKSYVQQYDIRVNHNLDKLYPSFSLLYKLTPIINFNASYRKSISLPSYTNLDPNISGYFDEYNTTTGNQYLQPDFYDNYEVSLSAFNYLRLGFQYTYSKQINMFSFEVEDQSLTVNQTTRSYNGMNSYNISLGIPIPFGLITKGKKFFKEPMNMDKMSFLYFYGMYNYYKLSDYIYPDGVKPVWFYAFYTQIALPKEFKLTGFYMFSSNSGYFRVYKANKPFNYSSIELSRSFYNKAVKASFGADNLFKSSRINAGIFSQNLITNFSQEDDNRLFYLKLSYNFGKLRKLKKEETLIEGEKKQDNNQILPVTPLK